MPYHQGDTVVSPTPTHRDPPEQAVMTSTSILDSIDLAQLARCLFEDSNNALFVFDSAEMRLVEVNSRAQALLRIPRQQLLQRHLASFIGAERASEFVDIVNAVETERDPAECETPERESRLRRSCQLLRDGDQPLPVTATLSRLVTDGEPLFLISLSDVTDCPADDFCQASESQRRPLDDDASAYVHGEEQLRTIFEQAAVGVASVELENGQFLQLNQKCLDLLDYESSEINQHSLVDLTHSDDVDSLRSEFVKLRAGETSDFGLDVRLIKKSGKPIWVHLTLSTSCGDAGPIFHVAIIENITGRKRAEERFEKSQIALEDAQSRASLGSWGFFPDRRKMIWSKEMFNLYHVDRRSSPPSTVEDFVELVHPEDRHLVMRRHRIIFETDEPIDNLDLRTNPANGALRWVDSSVTRIADSSMPDGFHIAGTVLDVTARKNSEQQLRMTRFAVERSNDAMVAINRDAKFIDVNENACVRLGYSREEMLTMSVKDIDPQLAMDNWIQIWSQIVEAGELVFETKHLTRAGTLFPVEVSASYFEFEGNEYLFAFARDITERKAAEERLHERELQLAHVSRLSTMGELIAGIAHEVNQPLYSIINYSKATSNTLKNPTSDHLRQIGVWNDQIGKAATRAGRIIKRLRGFVQHETPRTSSDLHEIIADALELVRHELNRARVSVSMDLATPGPFVQVGRVQIQQVFVNLLVNASEAIERHDSEVREIIVTTSHDNNQACVSVVDTGLGWAWGDDRKMFDAFETTKQGGLGMGLAISNTIIERFGGRLWAEANKSQGATFQFTLPLETRSGKHVS